MRPGVPSVAPQGYATALAGLWTELSRTLARLEQLAAEPAELDEDEALEVLPGLQYALHRASELAVGIEPPAGAESTHAELTAALADARDATAEVAEALELGGREALEPLVHEWRGALFRVRLARLRLAARQTASASLRPEETSVPPLRTALLATLLVLVGIAAFAAGTTIGSWPVWAAGVVAFVAGFGAYRA